VVASARYSAPSAFGLRHWALTGVLLWTAAGPQEAVGQGGTQSVRALMQLARTQVQDGNPSAALDSLRKARALAPNSEEVLSAFAQVALGARAITPAILTLESLVRMCPTVAQYQHILGVALLQAGDIPAALDALRQAERLEPNRPPTLVALGVALNARSSYADAKEVLNRALEFEPDHIDAEAALAEAEAALGDLGAADARARHVLARSKTHAVAVLVVGMVRLKQERYEEARDALKQAVEANPMSPKGHYQLSLAYARLGDDVNSTKHQELYRQRMREAEERLKDLRAQSGAPDPVR
jgi:tetratricopeptide (TPR) repeat protein